MTRWTLFLLLCVPTMAWSQTWTPPNRPTNGTVIDDCNMSVAPCPNWFFGGSPGVAGTDSNATVSPPGVTNFTFNPATNLGGGAPAFSLAAWFPREIYRAVNVMIDPNFQWRSTGEDKFMSIDLLSGASAWLELHGIPFSFT